MIVNRIAKAAHVGLDGEGARLYGGRWNSPGRPMLYTAASPSLAVLEVLVHLDLPPELLPLDYRLLSIEVPDDAPRLELDAVPQDSVAAGDAFLLAGQALCLRVPSQVVPQEINTLLNPRHAAFAEVRVVRDEPFRFDPRLF
ncbi:RES domain-containing protein [Caulobacter sp. D4A]|uniref:RES family NAD+ phosphorylase n=1 Tax=unclassified Caulobacter TaxID=2648921 RepID=UPI000D7382D7|nr:MULTISPECIES: RES family NAD+ phosphorylase [unclassified Caulobacter]PXA88584.1 RES domain-containing protein [Caulobacter sp. D4A]PXA96338.1 RES domain-containing protein [Caulobacter sp. D5]